MKFYLRQSKLFNRVRLFIFSAILVLLGSFLQADVLKVQADVQVLLVSGTTLPFGMVFPGQLLSKNYTVLLDASGEAAGYITTLEPITGFGNLCPHLQLANTDSPTEPDTLAGSTLTRPVDIIDNWQVSLDTPGIVGEISQSHSGGIVVTSGDYACKITVTTALENIGGCVTTDCSPGTGGGGGGGGSSGQVNSGFTPFPSFGNNPSDNNTSAPTVLGISLGLPRTGSPLWYLSLLVLLSITIAFSFKYQPKKKP